MNCSCPAAKPLFCLTLPAFRDHARGGRLSGMLDEFGSEDEDDRGRRRAQLGLRDAAGGTGEDRGDGDDDDDDDDGQGEVPHRCLLSHPFLSRLAQNGASGTRQ